MPALTFHHLGLAVRTPDAARTFLGALAYRMSAPVYDPLQEVNLQMCTHDAMPAVELIWPGDTPSPIGNMLKKREGLVYHMCYTLPEGTDAVALLESMGVAALPVVEAKPAILFGGTPVSFYHLQNIGLIEIIHGQPA